MGTRERVLRAIETPVTEADKLLDQLAEPDLETRLSILVGGWGRGLAAGLEEIAVALDELERERRAEMPPTRAEPPKPPGRLTAHEEAAEEPADLAGLREERLADEAEKSRERTAALERETEKARRDLNRP